jgi:hypothetical protein
MAFGFWNEVFACLILRFAVTAVCCIPLCRLADGAIVNNYMKFVRVLLCPHDHDSIVVHRWLLLLRGWAMIQPRDLTFQAFEFRSGLTASLRCV